MSLMSERTPTHPENALRDSLRHQWRARDDSHCRVSRDHNYGRELTDFPCGISTLELEDGGSEAFVSETS